LAGSDDRSWINDRRHRRDRRDHERRSGADRRLEDRGSEDDRREGDERRAKERRSGGDRRDETAWRPVPLEPAVNGPLDDAALVAAAVDARERARARFSGFKVGAALETAAGEVVTGCNVENATYGLTMCAERVALYKALSEGRDVFTRIAVVADTQDPTPPCGPCRQLLWEYCGDIDVTLANLSVVTRRMRLSELLPLPFDARLLDKDAKKRSE
jgi:cytidine deaminase